MNELIQRLKGVEAECGKLWWVGIPDGDELHIPKLGSSHDLFGREVAGGQWVLPVFTKLKNAQDFAESKMQRPEAFMHFLEDEGVNIPRGLVEADWGPHQTDWSQVVVMAVKMGADYVSINLFCDMDEDDVISMIPVPKKDSEEG